jgi:hypothetical protein
MPTVQRVLRSPDLLDRCRSRRRRSGDPRPHHGWWRRGWGRLLTRPASAFGVVDEQVAAGIGRWAVARPRGEVQERSRTVDGTLAGEAVEDAVDDIHLLGSRLVDVHSWPPRPDREADQQGSAGGGLGAGPVQAVNDDAVADLAPLGLGDVGFDKGIRCHPAMVSSDRPAGKADNANRRPDATENGTSERRFVTGLAATAALHWCDDGQVQNMNS